MARSIQEFLQLLLKSVTRYYTATYSSDTNLYQILKTYGAQFASGSLELDTTRNNAFVIACDPTKLFNNFGTFFNQNKYYLQSSTDDKYFSGSAVYIYDIPTTSFEHIQSVSSSYFDGFAIRGQQSPTQLTGNPGYLLGGTPFTAIQALDSVWINGTLYKPPTFDIFTTAQMAQLNPSTDVYTAPTLFSFPFSPDHTQGYIPLYGPWGLHSYNAPLGSGKFGPEQLCMWSITGGTQAFPSIVLTRTFDGVSFEAVNSNVFTFKTNGTYVASDSAKFSAANQAAIFHDKVYTAVAGIVRDAATSGSYKAYPACLSYNGTAATEAGLYSALVGSGSFVGDHIARTVFPFNNKLYCVFNRASGSLHLSPQIYNYDTLVWKNVPHVFTSNQDTYDSIAFDGDIYTTTYDVTTAATSIVKNFTTVHSTFASAVTSFVIHKNRLYVGSTNGRIYRLSVDKTTWDVVAYLATSSTVNALGSYETLFHSYLLALADGKMWSSDADIVNYKTSTVSGSSFRYNVTEQIALPSYRKQLSFMMEAAVKGGTPAAMTSMVDAFTLINPDIREFVRIPSWKLKSTVAPVSITQLSSNVLQFNGTSRFMIGAHALAISGSLPSDKVTAGYLVLSNTNNTVTIAPIYEQYLRL